MELLLKVLFAELSDNVAVVDTCKNVLTFENVGMWWKILKNFNLVFKQFLRCFGLDGGHFDYFDGNFFPVSHVETPVGLTKISFTQQVIVLEYIVLDLFSDHVLFITICF